MPNQRNCMECNNLVVGRIDKLFCDDGCRSSYHNKKNQFTRNLIRNINYLLLKNRRILLKLNLGSNTKVHRDTLLVRGFVFNYFTSTCQNKKGVTCYFIYEQGYFPLENDLFALVRETKDNVFSIS